MLCIHTGKLTFVFYTYIWHAYQKFIKYKSTLCKIINRKKKCYELIFFTRTVITN